MSTFFKANRKCAICGKEHTFTVVGSTNAMGYMDLDTRPPEMKRSTLPYEIQLCDDCFYANYDIEEKIPEFDKKILNASNYLAVAKDESINKTARAFILAAYTYQVVGSVLKAGIYYLNASWIFDDIKDEARAVRTRVRALKLLSEHVEKTADVNIAVLTVDLQRRIGDFDGAVETAEQLIEYGVEEFLEKILRLQIKLCYDNDKSFHNVGEVE